MRARTSYLAAAVAAMAAFAACHDQPTSPQLSGAATEQGIAGKNDKVKKDKGRAALLTNVPVSGVLSDGGSFAGTFTATHVAIDEATRTLTVTGVLSGTATTIDGATTAIEQVITSASAISRAGSGDAAVVRTVAMQTTCDILFLDLGAIHLDLLGLTVDLARVILDVNAVTGAGNLLGNLLCAVLGLLDGVALLSSITQLIDNINAILSGIGGLGGMAAQVSPLGVPVDIGFQIHS